MKDKLPSIIAILAGLGIVGYSLYNMVLNSNKAYIPALIIGIAIILPNAIMLIHFKRIQTHQDGKLGR